MRIRCPTCGATVRDTDIACRFCGRMLRSNTPRSGGEPGGSTGHSSRTHRPRSALPPGALSIIITLLAGIFVLELLQIILSITL